MGPRQFEFESPTEFARWSSNRYENETTSPRDRESETQIFDKPSQILEIWRLGAQTKQLKLQMTYNIYQLKYRRENLTQVPQQCQHRGRRPAGPKSE